MTDSSSWLACGVAYLLGSIPFGLIVARIFKVQDLTRRGSGNIGATNVSRVVGFWPAGAITFLLDVLKGALPALLVGPWAEDLRGAVIGHVSLGQLTIWSVGFSAVLGHCFSPWLYFRGGKGVATGFGVLLVLSPWAAVAGLLTFGLVFATRRIGSLGSISGLVVASATHLVLNPLGSHLWAGAAMISVILFKHEANIDALLEGRERVF